MNPTATLKLAALVTIFAFSLACSGSKSSPTSPVSQVPTIKVPTQWGAIAVTAGSCGDIDAERIVDSVTRGYTRAVEVAGSAVNSVTLEGMTMRGEIDLECSGTAAYGCYFFDRDQVLFRCGHENVVEHELQHRFCDQLDRPCDCYKTDHAGGVDLNCQPT